jgi:hypothetical protein
MRLRIFMLFALLVGIANIAAAHDPSPQGRAKELMGIADDIFQRSKAVLTEDARTELKSVVMYGAKKVDSEQQMQMARISMARLAQAMVDGCPDKRCPQANQLTVTSADLRGALSRLCPLYPFC